MSWRRSHQAPLGSYQGVHFAPPRGSYDTPTYIGFNSSYTTKSGGGASSHRTLNLAGDIHGDGSYYGQPEGDPYYDGTYGDQPQWENCSLPPLPDPRSYEVENRHLRLPRNQRSGLALRESLSPLRLREQMLFDLSQLLTAATEDFFRAIQSRYPHPLWRQGDVLYCLFLHGYSRKWQNAIRDLGINGELFLDIGRNGPILQTLWSVIAPKMPSKLQKRTQTALLKAVTLNMAHQTHEDLLLSHDRHEFIRLQGLAQHILLSNRPKTPLYAIRQNIQKALLLLKHYMAITSAFSATDSIGDFEDLALTRIQRKFKALQSRIESSMRNNNAPVANDAYTSARASITIPPELKASIKAVEWAELRYASMSTAIAPTGVPNSVYARMEATQTLRRVKSCFTGQAICVETRKSDIASTQLGIITR